MAPLTGDDFHNPDLTGPRASHNIPNGGLFSSYATVHINVPPQVVYDAILNVGDWKEWNSFIYDVKITKNPNPHEVKGSAHKRMTGGTCMIFYRNLTRDPPEKIEGRQVVTLVEKLKGSSEGHSKPCVTRIRWMLDNAAITTPGFLLKCERINEIEEVGDGTTIYRTWEVFAGPVARTMRKKFEKNWRDRMQESAQDLKKWCETKHARGESVATNSAEGQSVGGQAAEPDRLASE
jgi:hypothetical protein